MKLKNIEFKSSLAEINPQDHYHHPGLRIARFVFCDDKPNQNNQGVEYEDFAEIIKSAIGTPVKVKFLGQTVSGHVGSIPIGHISNMFENELEDGTHQLIADAMLYADEYPDEVDYLEEAFAQNKAPGISFEMTYKNSLIKDGVEWLKGLVTRAATFVRDPAYGSRTALLALASNKDISAETFMKELTALTQELEPIPKDKGGNNVTEEEAKKLREELDTAKAEIQRLSDELDTVKTSNTDLTGKLELAEQKNKSYAQKELISSRTQAIIDAGVKIDTSDTEKLEKSFWVHLPDEAFAEYVDDLKGAAAVEKKAAASLTPRVGVPRFTGNDDANPSSLIQRMREIKNTRVASE